MKRYRSAPLLLAILRSTASRRGTMSLADALATRAGDELRAMSEDRTIDVTR